MQRRITSSHRVAPPAGPDAPAATATPARPGFVVPPVPEDTSHSEYEALFASMELGLRVMDADYTIRRINRTFGEMFGLDPAQAVGRKCWELFPNCYCHTPACRARRIYQGERLLRVEMDRKRADGALVPCLVTATPYYHADGTLAGVIEAFRDVTEHRELEERVKETEKQYHALVDLGRASGASVFILQDVDGIEGKHVYVSDQWSLLTGYSQAELLRMSNFDLLTPADRARLLAYHRRREDEPNPVSGPFELTIVRKDGRKVPIFSEGARITFGGRPGVLVFAQDVTARRQVEKRLRSSQSQLHTLARRIITAQEEERSRVARELHDQLSQDLIALRMETSLMADRHPGETGDKLNQLVGALDRLLDLVHGISTDLRPQMLDELGLLGAIQNYAAGFSERTGLPCPVATQDSLPQVLPLSQEAATESYRIVQEALINVQRHAHATRAAVRIYMRGDRCVISVTDNGVGMSRKELEAKSAIGIMGMRERASIIGGKLRIVSKPGHGTRVALHLPLSAPAPGRERRQPHD